VRKSCRLRQPGMVGQVPSAFTYFVRYHADWVVLPVRTVQQVKRNSRQSSKHNWLCSRVSTAYSKRQICTVPPPLVLAGAEGGARECESPLQERDCAPCFGPNRLGLDRPASGSRKVGAARRSHAGLKKSMDHIRHHKARLNCS